MAVPWTRAKRAVHGGGDLRKLEPIIRRLQKLYRENPSYFDIPEFAQKVY